MSLSTTHSPLVSGAAPSVATTEERLAIAERVLLEPFGLTRHSLHSALAAMHTHQVDDADLYFQTTCSEGWSLEEGIVKTGSFSIDQGVGVRAVSGEKTAFAYSDDISEASLLDAVKTVRTIGAAGQQGGPAAGHRQGRPQQHPDPHGVAAGRAAGHEDA